MAVVRKANHLSTNGDLKYRTIVLIGNFGITDLTKTWIGTFTIKLPVIS